MSCCRAKTAGRSCSASRIIRQRREIPILICSVLEMEALALSLGADGYMKKPPSRDEFLALLGEWH